MDDSTTSLSASCSVEGAALDPGSAVTCSVEMGGCDAVAGNDPDSLVSAARAEDRADSFCLPVPGAAFGIPDRVVSTSRSCAGAGVGSVSLAGGSQRSFDS